MSREEIIARLAANRSDILRAEVAGLLHAAHRLRSDRRSPKGYTPSRYVCPLRELKPAPETGEPERVARARNRFVSFIGAQGPFPMLEAILNAHVITVPGEEAWTVGEVITLWNAPFTFARGENPREDGYAAPSSDLLGIRCHVLELFQAAHASASEMKLPKPEEREDVPLTAAGDQMSTPFGYSNAIKWPSVENVQRGMEQLIQAVSKTYQALQTVRADWRKISADVYADDRMAINDVSVWNYSQAVAAFFKAGVAKVWAEGKWPDNVSQIIAVQDSRSRANVPLKTGGLFLVLD